MTATLALRRVRRLLAGRQPAGGAFALQTERFVAAQTAIRAFYAFALFFLADTILAETAKFAGRPPADPLWPLTWLHWTNPALAIRGLGAFAGFALLAAVLAPGWRIVRAAGWLALLEFAALTNSYGKIGHSLHLSVWVAFILIALPTSWTQTARRTNRRTRQATLLVFWTCQAAVLLSYSMSGLGKLGGAIYQVAAGQPSALSPGAVGAHIAERLLQTHSQSAVGAWLVAHPYLTWPAMPGAIAVELLAFWAAFRPQWQRPWAAALIALHLGIYVAMTINFPQNCFLLALLFFLPAFGRQPERLH